MGKEKVERDRKGEREAVECQDIFRDTVSGVPPLHRVSVPGGNLPSHTADSNAFLRSNHQAPDRRMQLPGG